MKRVPLQRKTPLSSRGPRRKRCPSCRVMFTPARSSQAVCGEIECAIAHGQSEKGRAIAGKALAEVGRREIKVLKEKLKSRADHLKDTQQAFNAWIPIPPNDDHAACNERCVADYRQGSAARHDPSQACEGSVPGDPGPSIL